MTERRKCIVFAESHGRTIEEVLIGFPAEKIHDAMRKLKWRWWNGHRGKVPEKEWILQAAKELLLDALTKDGRSISSGGITARRWQDSLSLTFQITAMQAEKLELNALAKLRENP